MYNDLLENNNLDFPKWQKLHLNIDKNKLEKKVGTLNNFINNIISNIQIYFWRKSDIQKE